MITMDDEVEVDIVGEFNDKLLSPSGGGCEEMSFNINEFLPFLGSNSWLLSPDQVWNFENNPDTKNKVITDNSVPEREVDITPVVSKESKSDSWTSHRKHWTDSEKGMFQRGLKMYGHSWTKISKFIGTRTTLQVKNFARQYLKQFEKADVNNDQSSLQLHEDLVDGSSPIIDHKYPQRSPDVKKPTNVIVSSCIESKKPVKRKKVKLVRSKEIVRLHKESCSSDTEDIDIEDLGDASQHCDLRNVNTNHEPVLYINHPKQMPHLEDTYNPQSEGLLKISENINQIDDNCIIADGTCNSLPSMLLEEKDSKNASQIDANLGHKDESSYDIDDLDDGDVFRSSSDHHHQKIFNFSIPEKDIILERNTISDEERAFHVEFFEGRPQKTPERYLKIRNYILDSWEKCKPSYLNKTSVRPGLKNCGDVNCIGRIHMYLEQTGAINFGCDQTIYTRPLTLSGRPLPSSKKSHGNLNLATQFARMETMRPRKRKIPVLTYDSEHGGYTITHGEDGQIIDVAEGTDGPTPTPKRVKSGDDPFKLILCSEFSATNPAPFTLTVHVEAIAIMDVHAHLSHLEVMGLLGGHFDPEKSLLHIVTAEPCESLSTGLECEMDSVSQTLASDKLQQEGYSVVGWYHSHPTFAPNPSIRDLETQTKFQGWFIQGGAPFLGVIISPHLLSSAHSKVRYLIVGDEVVPPEGYRKPFKFIPTEFICDKSADEIIQNLNGLLNRWKEGSESPKMSKTPLLTMNKLLSSLYYHLTQFAMDPSIVLMILNEFGKMLVSYLMAVEPPTTCFAKDLS